MMAVTLSVKDDLKKIQKQLTETQRKAIPNATRRTINKVATTVRKEANQEIRQKYNLKAGDVNESLKLRRANFKKLSATITATGRPLSLTRYGATVRTVSVTVAKGRYKGTKRKQQAISVKIRKDRGKRIYDGAFTPGGLKVRGRLTGPAFRRQEPGRLPLEKIATRGIPSMFAEKRIERANERTARSRWDKVFPQELAFELKRVAKK